MSLVQHGALIGKTFYLSNAALDIDAGTQVKTWDWKRGGHGCGTLSASATHMFWRGYNPRFAAAGSSFKGETFCAVNRPGCWIGMIPAGGLVLMPESSSGCSCSYAVQSSMAYRPVE